MRGMRQNSMIRFSSKNKTKYAQYEQNRATFKNKIQQTNHVQDDQNRA